MNINDLIHSLNTYNPTGGVQQSDSGFTRLLQQDQNLYLELLISSINSNKLKESGLKLAIVILRSVLPSKVPLHGDFLHNFNFEVLDLLMETLFGLFHHQSDNVRYHAAVSYGRFAMFRMKSRQECNKDLELLMRQFQENVDEKVLTCCGIALDLVADGLWLSFEEKKYLFKTIFHYVCSDEASMFLKGIFIPFFSKFINDIPLIFQENPKEYIESLIGLTMIPVLADAAFMLWSEIVPGIYNYLKFAPQIMNISYEYLNSYPNQNDLILNILRFWINLSKAEMSSNESLCIIQNTCSQLLPILFQILINDESENCFSEEEWNFTSATFTALLNFCQAAPNEFYKFFVGYIQNNENIIITLHGIYSLLSTNNENIISAICETAVKVLKTVFQSSVPRIINYGILILTQLIKYIEIPAEYIQICFENISSSDEILAKNAADALLDLSTVSDISKYVLPMINIITTFQNPALANILVDFLISYVRIINDLDFYNTIIKYVLNFTNIFLKECPNDEILSASIDLINSILLNSREKIEVNFNDIFQIALSSIETLSAPSALQLFGVLCVINQKEFLPYLETTIMCVDTILKENNTYHEKKAALNCLTLIIPRIDISSYVPHLLEQCFLLLTNPDLSESIMPCVLDTISSIIYYYFNSIIPYATTIADIVNSASEVMMEPAEDDQPDITFIVSVTECTRMLLKIQDNVFREKMVKISIKVINEIVKLNIFTTNLLYEFVDLIVSLVNVLSQDQLNYVFAHEGIKKVLLIALENGDEKCKTDSKEILTNFKV